jgi:hypothetical protein
MRQGMAKQPKTTVEQMLELGDFGSVSKSREGLYTANVSVDGELFEQQDRSLDKAIDGVMQSIRRYVSERDRGLNRLRAIAGAVAAPEPFDEPAALPEPER